MSYDSSRQAGKIENYEGRGVWVPDGLNASGIMEGAKALERQFGIAPYTARDMAIAVLLAVQSNAPCLSETGEP